jgi:hypothetical protein
MRKVVFVFSAMVGLCVAVPASAQGIDVQIGGHRDRDREIVRSHGEYHGDRALVVRRDRDHDRRWHHRDWDRDRDHRRVIIEH